MSLVEAQGALGKSTRELILHWQRTRERWRDGRADAFEREVLEALDAEVRQAESAMNAMGAALQQAKMLVGPSRDS